MNATQEEIEREREHMHRCLVREVIKMRVKDRDSAYRWLNGCYDNSGRWKKGWNQLHPESKLDEDVRDQWSKGNRGNEGEWK